MYKRLCEGELIRLTVLRRGTDANISRVRIVYLLVQRDVRGPGTTLQTNIPAINVILDNVDPTTVVGLLGNGYGKEVTSIGDWTPHDSRSQHHEGC